MSHGPCSPDKYKIGRTSPSNVDIFLKTMVVVEGKLSSDHRYSRPQKQRGKSPPRTYDFFDERFGARTSTKVRKRNTFHSSGQIPNNLDWGKKIPFFPVQLTTCRTGNLTRLVHTLAICVTIHRISFRVGFSITTIIGALVFVRGLLLSVVRSFFTVVVGIKWIQEAAVRYHAQDGTEGTP